MGGNPHFFFLPPLVGQPTFSGTFNPNLRPVVDICQLVVDASGNPLQCDVTTPEINPGTVQLDLIDQQYEVNWHTDQPAVDLTKFYRIQVRGAPGAKKVLGFADVAPVARGGQLENVNTGQYIGLVDGRTLPIKFRIEAGAFCTTQADCGEATIGAGGGTVITNTGLAGALFPPGALSADVVVTIETVSERPCLPIDLLQRSGCYQFSTDPGPNTFTQLVTAGMCVDIEGLTPTEISLLHLHQLDFVEGAPVVTVLPNVAAHFLTCDAPHPPPTSLGLGGGRLERLLALGKQSIGTLVSIVVPEPLFAAHLGVGGLTGSFSRIGWALPAQMTKRAGDGQTAPAGTAVATPPSVIVEDSSGAPVPGEAVTFSVGSGGGTITGDAATTDATGTAAVGSWTLGPTAGANTLIATSRGAVGSPLTVTATGNARAPAAHFANLTPRTTTLTIDGLNVTFSSNDVLVDGFMVNTTDATLFGVNVVSYIDQGATSRIESSTPGCLASGTLPVGTCGLALGVLAGNAFTPPGTGTLVPGAATLRVQLEQGGSVLDVVTFPVTLVTAPVRILAVSLSSPTLSLAGPDVPYTLTVINETGGTVGGLIVNAVMEQGNNFQAGGGFLIAGCGPNPGELLPGTCVTTMGVTGATGLTALTLSGTGPIISGNRLVSGIAAGFFQLFQNFCCGPRISGSTLPVTLVGP